MGESIGRLGCIGGESIGRLGLYRWGECEDRLGGIDWESFLADWVV